MPERGRGPAGWGGQDPTEGAGQRGREGPGPHGPAEGEEKRGPHRRGGGRRPCTGSWAWDLRRSHPGPPTSQGELTLAERSEAASEEGLGRGCQADNGGKVAPVCVRAETLCALFPLCCVPNTEQTNACVSVFVY